MLIPFIISTNDITELSIRTTVKNLVKILLKCIIITIFNRIIRFHYFYILYNLIVLKRSALVYFIQNIPIILPVIILMMAFFFYT